MTSLVLTNNAQSLLTAGISAVATSITVTGGQGALFPNPGANQWFPLTLIRADGTGSEIVRATSRSTDTIVIERAQEGTTAITFITGDYVSHRMTAASHLDLASQDTAVIQTAAGAVNAYTVALDGVSAYEDGLSFSFVPNLSNTGPATIKVNTLAATIIRKYDRDGSGSDFTLSANDIILARAATVHYEASSGFFILDDPNIGETPDGSASVKGILQLSADSPSYNTSGDNTKPITQKTGSQLVEDAISTLVSPAFPPMWSYEGSGVTPGADTIPTGNTEEYNPSLDNEYTTFEVQSGATFTADRTGLDRSTGVLVLRATISIVINGMIVLPDAPEAGDIDATVGPGGQSDIPPSGLYLGRGFRPYLGRQGLDGRPCTLQQVRNAIKQGADMERFRGSCGTGIQYLDQITGNNYDPAGTTPLSGARVAACGGMILIAPSITIGSTAQFVMNSRKSQTSDTNSGDASGGMLLCVVPSSGDLTVSGTAGFAAGFDPTVFESEATLLTRSNARAAGGSPGTGECNASSGQFFEVRASQGNVVLRF